MDRSEKDTVLISKQYLHSTVASQAPLLFFPARIGGVLSFTDLKVNPRNPIGKKTADQFLKTARAVSGHPWNLLRAGKYLENLVESDEAPQTASGPELHVFFHYR